MKSKWKVTSNPIGDRIKYAVYRLLDSQKTDHSGNREFATIYLDAREQAQQIADELNKADPETVEKMI